MFRQHRFPFHCVLASRIPNITRFRVLYIIRFSLRFELVVVLTYWKTVPEVVFAKYWPFGPEWIIHQFYRRCFLLKAEHEGFRFMTLQPTLSLPDSTSRNHLCQPTLKKPLFILSRQGFSSKKRHFPAAGKISQPEQKLAIWMFPQIVVPPNHPF